MKIILVTSDLTYCPNNYDEVFEHVIKNANKQIAGVVLIKINKFRTLLKIPYLYTLGCKNISKVLLHNLLTSIFTKKKISLLKKQEIPFITVKDINETNTVNWLKKNEPDLVINTRSRCIYKEKTLELPTLGCINVHHGLLPEQAGLFCDLFAIADSKITGFTIHKMTKKIDQGEILYQEVVESRKDYIQYLNMCISKEKVAIINLINKISQDKILPKGILIEKAINKRKFTKTPSYKEIKEIQKKGIKL